MLKAYAVALMLSTTAPANQKAEETVQAPVDQQPVTTEAWKRSTRRF